MSERPRSSWFEPQTLVGIMGLAMVAYGGYQTFQADIGDRVAALEVRIAVLEVKGDDRGRRIDRLSEAVERRGTGR